MQIDHWHCRACRRRTKNRRTCQKPRITLDHAMLSRFRAASNQPAGLLAKTRNVPGADGAGEVGPGSGEARLPAAQGERPRDGDQGYPGSRLVWSSLFGAQVENHDFMIVFFFFSCWGGEPLVSCFVCACFLGGSLQKRRGTPFPGFFLRGSLHPKRNPHPWERKLRLLGAFVPAQKGE